MSRYSYLLVAVVSIAAVARTPAARADSFQVLYSFKYSASDGARPTGTPTLVGNVLYGLTSEGGANNDGAVFRYDLTTNTETAPYAFGGAPMDGSSPYGSLAYAGANVFYGLTNMGGSKNLGTIFQYDGATHAETPLYSFTGYPADGSNPVGSPLILGNYLYGTTSGGGGGPGGTVFQYDTISHAEKVLYTTSGPQPYGSLIVNNNILYGTTAQGGQAGAGNFGTIFQYDLTNNTGSVLHSFSGGTSDGAYPYGSLVLNNGKLFGVAEVGGVSGNGVIFQYDLTTQKQSVLHSFAGGKTDGGFPEGTLLLLNDVLYGMTFDGGADDDGVIFGFDLATDKYSLLHTFTNSSNDGSAPTWGSLIASGDTLYGVAPFRGAQDDGVIFSLEAPEPDCLSLLATSCGLALLRRRRA